MHNSLTMGHEFLDNPSPAFTALAPMEDIRMIPHPPPDV